MANREHVTTPKPFGLCCAMSLDGKIVDVRNMLTKLAEEVNANVVFYDGNPVNKTLQTDADGSIVFGDAPDDGSVAAALMDPGAPIITVAGDGLSASIRIKRYDGTMREDQLPLSSRENVGLAMPSDLAAIDNALMRIATLEQGSIGGSLYKSNANYSALTDAQRDADIAAIKGTPVIVGDIVIDVARGIWRRAYNGWVITDTVTVSVSNGATVVVSSNDDGKIYIETDLTMSVKGWDALKVMINGAFDDTAIINDATGFNVTLHRIGGSSPQQINLKNVSDGAGTDDEQRTITRRQYDSLALSVGGGSGSINEPYMMPVFQERSISENNGNTGTVLSLPTGDITFMRRTTAPWNQVQFSGDCTAFGTAYGSVVSPEGYNVYSSYGSGGVFPQYTSSDQWTFMTVRMTKRITPTTGNTGLYTFVSGKGGSAPWNVTVLTHDERIGVPM